jgi:predicted TIM-barrel fold metal-dependent hydrolase
VLLTNYRGCYLGDPRFDPVFDELHRRGSVVILHPTAPCGGNSVAPGYPPPLVEFIFETTRAVVNLALTRTVDRFPGIRLVVPHGGAALPVLVDRVDRVGAALDRAAGRDRLDVRDVLRRMHYDVAGGTPDGLLPGLLSMVGPDRLLYGSDYPFTPGSRVLELAALLRASLLNAGERRRAERERTPAAAPRQPRHRRRRQRRRVMGQERRHGATRYPGSHRERAAGRSGVG